MLGRRSASGGANKRGNYPFIDTHYHGDEDSGDDGLVGLVMVLVDLTIVFGGVCDLGSPFPRAIL